MEKIHFHGLSMQVPQSWRHKTLEYSAEDGVDSFGLEMCTKGRDAKSINLSWGVMPEGTNAYTEACVTYEQVVGEEDLTENDQTIMSFRFQDHEAHGFDVCTESGHPGFFFCVELPSASGNILLTALVCATNLKELEELLDYVEAHLNVE